MDCTTCICTGHYREVSVSDKCPCSYLMESVHCRESTWYTFTITEGKHPGLSTLQVNDWKLKCIKLHNPVWLELLHYHMLLKVPYAQLYMIMTMPLYFFPIWHMVTRPVYWTSTQLVQNWELAMSFHVSTCTNIIYYVTIKDWKMLICVMFALNNGCTLRVIVSVIALWSFPILVSKL